MCWVNYNKQRVYQRGFLESVLSNSAIWSVRNLYLSPRLPKMFKMVEVKIRRMRRQIVRKFLGVRMITMDFLTSVRGVWWTDTTHAGPTQIVS